MTNTEKHIENLQKLLDRTYDSYDGYSQAAEATDNKALRLYLFNVSLERKDNAGLLAEQISALGGEPSKSGTIAGAAHRTWLDIKSALSSKTDESIMEECLRGEKKLVEDYMEVLQEDNLPRSIQNILARQLNVVQARVGKLEATLETEFA